MKRGADAMDGGARDRYDGSRSDEGGQRRGPKHDAKRARRGEERRSHYGPVGGATSSHSKVEKSGNSHGIKSVGSSSGSGSSSGPGATVKLLADEKETDPHRLAQRQKQIDYGKNTIGYDRYCALVPRHQRRPGKHPMTPDKTARIGKKVFDARVRKWRQALHKFDPPELAQAATTATGAVSEPLASAQASSADVGAAGEAIAAAEMQTTPGTSEGSAQTPAPPMRSIYDNFEENEVGQDDDSDDDLL